VEPGARLGVDALQEDGFEIRHLQHPVYVERPLGALRALSVNNQDNSAINESTFCDVIPCRCSSFTITAGAPSHAPRHSANSSVILPSFVVPPGFTCSLSQNVASKASPPRRAHAKLRQTHSRVC